MTKPKAPKIVKAQSGPAEDKPKKKKEAVKITTIGPVAEGERQWIDVKYIKQGEKVIIDTNGKGTLQIGKFIMSGGTLQCVKSKRPFQLVFRMSAPGEQEGGTAAPMK
jgi:hypothetical protein